MGIVIGITGGIGTGKSTVLEYFQNLGASIISADDVARDIMKKGSPASEAVRKYFGDDVFDSNGSLDRKKLADIVFSDNHKREQLEQITHPIIIAKINDEISRFKKLNTDSILAIEVPLLFECEMQSQFDKVLLVISEQEIQISRLKNRRSMTEDEAINRINSQMPVDQKIKLADWVVINNGSFDELKHSASEVWQEINLL